MDLFFKSINTLKLFGSPNGISKEQINRGNKFVKNLMDSYRKRCKEININPKFYDSLSYMNDNNVSATFIFSQTRECIIHIYRSSPSKLTVIGTEFPAQFYALNGCTYRISNLFNSPSNKEKFNIESFLAIYDTLNTGVRIRKGFAILIDNFWFSMPSTWRIISGLDDSTIIFLRRIHIKGFNIFQVPYDKTLFASGLAILFGSKEVTNFDGEIVEEAAQYLLDNEVQDYFFVLNILEKL